MSSIDVGKVKARPDAVKNESSSPINQWAKAGLMLRDSLAAGAKHASVFITPGNGAAFQRRLTTGGTSTNNHTGCGTASVPIWLRLTRSGTTVSGYNSTGVCSQTGTTTGPSWLRHGRIAGPVSWPDFTPRLQFHGPRNRGDQSQR